MFKLQELLDLRAHTGFWNDPQVNVVHHSNKHLFSDSFTIIHGTAGCHFDSLQYFNS